MAVNLTNIYVHMIIKNFRRIRFLGARFEQSKCFKPNSNFYNFESIIYYFFLLTIYKMANRTSPQSPPLQDQVPNQMKIVIEIPQDPDMPEPEMTPSLVAGNNGSDNFLGLCYRVDVEALEEWVVVTNFLMGGCASSVEKPEIISNFRASFWIMN